MKISNIEEMISPLVNNRYEKHAKHPLVQLYTHDLITLTAYSLHKVQILTLATYEVFMYPRPLWVH